MTIFVINIRVYIFHQNWRKIVAEDGSRHQPLHWLVDKSQLIKDQGIWGAPWNYHAIYNNLSRIENITLPCYHNSRPYMAASAAYRMISILAAYNLLHCHSTHEQHTCSSCISLLTRNIKNTVGGRHKEDCSWLKFLDQFKNFSIKNLWGLGSKTKAF